MTPRSKTAIVTHDILRTPQLEAGNHWPNLRWLEGLVRASLLRGGFEIEVLAPHVQGGDFDVAEVARNSNLRLELPSWAILHSSTDPDGALGLALDSRLANANLLIGFELPPSLIAACIRCGLDWIDLGIDPIRFGPEKFLSVSTSISALGDRLRPLVVPDALIRTSADGVRAREARKLPWLPALPNEPIGVFVGQTEIDAAVITSGRLIRPIDKISEISYIAQDMSLLLVSPHPYWPNLDHIKPIMDFIPNSIICRTSIYNLFSDVRITDIIALSSSALTEAEFFNKRSHRLITSDRELILLNHVLSRARVRLQDFLKLLNWYVTGSPHCQFATASRQFIVTSVDDTLRIDWGRDRPDATPVPLLAPYRVLVPQTPEGTGMLASGWHSPEPWGAWSSEKRAQILVRVSEVLEHKRLRLNLRAHLGASRSVQLVSCRVQTGPVATRRVVGEGIVDFVLDVDVPSGLQLAGGFVRLNIEAANVVLASDLALNEDARPIGIGLRSIMVLPNEHRGQSDMMIEGTNSTPNADFYANLHATHLGYKENNWLTEVHDLVGQIPGDTLLEIGCGNGRYLAVAAAERPHVVGCDWVESASVAALRQQEPRIDFISCDLTQAVPIVGADIVASADVLEHLPTQDIPIVVQRLHAAGRWQFHVIACYDDTISHLTVRPASWWLAQFCQVDPNTRLIRSCFRHGDAARPICILSNFPFFARGIVPDPLAPEMAERLLANAAEAEARATEAQARAEQAEARATEAQARAEQAEARATEAQARAEQAEVSARQSQDRALQALARATALEGSTTWRATRPLRASVQLLRTGFRRLPSSAGLPPEP